MIIASLTVFGVPRYKHKLVRFHEHFLLVDTCRKSCCDGTAIATIFERLLGNGPREGRGLSGEDVYTAGRSTRSFLLS